VQLVDFRQDRRFAGRFNGPPDRHAQQGHEHPDDDDDDEHFDQREAAA
jgi:hypothetical protein